MSKTSHEVYRFQLEGVSADRLLERAHKVLSDGLGMAVKVSDHEWVDLFLDVGMYLNTQKAPVETKNNNIQEG